MNSANATVLLLLFVALSIYVVHYWTNVYQDELIKIYRYRLYAVRDQLIMLVAEEKIDQDDETFAFLYKTTNKLLPICRPMELKTILRILVAKDRSDSHWESNLETALHHNNTEIRSLTKELISTLVDIIVHKSITVRLASKCVWLLHHLRQFMPRRMRANEAFQVYRQLDHMRRAT